MSEPVQDSTQRTIAQAVATRPAAADASSAATFWATLNNGTADRDAFCRAWLAAQCAALAGATAALLLWQPDTAPGHHLVRWPDDGGPADLVRLAERAMSERRVVVAWGRREQATTSGTPTIALYVAQFVGPETAPYGAVAIALILPRGIASADPEAVARQLRVGSGWLESLLWRDRSASAASVVDRAAVGLDLLAVAGEHRRLAASAIAIVNEIATRLACDRVSIGVVRRGSIRLRAISHSATFEKRSDIASAIEDAMEEALSQRAVVAFPPTGPSQRQINVAHRDLAAKSGGRACILSVVLPGAGGQPSGVITLERHRDEPFDAPTVKLAETLGALVGPVVSLQGDAERWVTGSVFSTSTDVLRALFGPRRPAIKLLAIAVVAVALALVFVRDDYRVGARSLLEGEVQRAAVVPFDGIIRSAPSRAGDVVREGDVLGALDDKDLVLDRRKWQSEREKLLQKQRDALAKHDRSAVAVATAQIEAAESQLALAEEKLARSKIRAPFDGIVVSGDLSQMLGSPVEKGKVLFEIAPLNAYRLVVQVDERDVRWVEPGQTGSLALASMPARRLPFTVNKVTPVATAEEGRNYFRVEAALDQTGDLPIRPGMEGVAKIDTGPRNIVWVWLHPIVDWLRLTAWKWLP